MQFMYFLHHASNYVPTYHGVIMLINDVYILVMNVSVVSNNTINIKSWRTGVPSEHTPLS